MMLRGLAAAAAATAVIGAVVLRHWDAQAGKQVADLTRGRASDEWRYEERVAELESDLDESRELRVKLEQRLRAKRSELAGLRNEHAALLRRYATAETERASALEGRRLLEIESADPTRELMPAPAASAEEAGAVAAPAEAAADEAAESAETAEAAEGAEDAQDSEGAQGEPEAPAAFASTGSQLFLRAKGALARFGDEDDESDERDGTAKAEAEDAEPEGAESADVEAEDVEAADVEAVDAEATDVEAADAVTAGADEAAAPVADAEPTDVEPVTAGEVKSIASKGIASKDPAKGRPKGVPKGEPEGASDGEPVKVGSAEGAAAGAAGNNKPEAAQEDEARGKPEAVDAHERATAAITARGAQPAQLPSGHFVAPTAVAVVPPTPVRRPTVEGGFDFFGAKQGAEPDALEAVQNEDLADVVGQEALALHKAESEAEFKTAEFKTADEESRGAGQVIDLTAHDETEQIDLQGLRSAVS